MLDIMPPMPVLADFFWLDNIENLDIILGLYQGMMTIKEMDKSFVGMAFQINQLDRSIHYCHQQNCCHQDSMLSSRFIVVINKIVVIKIVVITIRCNLPIKFNIM
jgi:hypothetical protein